MIAVALRGLAGRKLRAALTAIAIILGVAMISGTYVLTDTIDKAFNSIFEDTRAQTDVVVSGKSSGISFQGDTADTPPIPASVLAKVKAIPDVDAAAGIITDENTKILKPNGKAVQASPTFGYGLDPTQPRFNPLTLVAGEWPTGSNDVVIDESTANNEHFKIGDTIQISTDQPAQPFHLVGLVHFGDVKSLGSVTISAFTVPTAQQLFDQQDTYDQIAVSGKAGVTPEQLAKEVRQVIPPTTEALTGAQQAKEDKKDVSFTKFIRYFLLSFAGIALFVGAFVIFNTLSITVAQRTREFATLRTVGASRRQVLWSVILEAFVIGLIASIIGLFAGLGLAWGLNELFKLLNAELPTQGTVFAPRTVIVALVVGTGITVLAGLFPAIRATRVPPIAAVREGAELPASRFSRFVPYIAGVIVVFALTLLGMALFKDSLATAPRLISMAGGVLLLFVGVAMLSSHLVRPITALVGWPATRIGGVAGKLAKRNSVRNPGRTAATAAALMIGVALVTFVAVLANGMKASNHDAINDQVKAQYVITSQDGFTPFVSGAGDALRTAQGTSLVTPVRSELASVNGSGQYLTGIDPKHIAEVYSFDWKKGSGSDAVLQQLGTDGAVVSKEFADQKDLKVGSPIKIRTPDNETAALTVKAIYEPPPFFPILGAVSISKEKFDTLYENPRNSYVFVNVPGEPTAASTASLNEAVAKFPDAKVQTKEQWIQKQDQDFNNFLNLLYVLLALAVIVSLFGMVNTLVLSVYERTRELGMLRAVGMTRRQTRRMIRHESVITSLIGAALGLPLGIFLAVLVTKALSQFNVKFAIPWSQLIVFTIVAIIVGILAAIAPARRAARLNVLQALQYE